MELTNEGVVNLMTAVTQRAYADYVLFGTHLKNCEYEVVNGVIHVTHRNGRKIVDGWEQRRMDKMANLYNTARMFFEGTKWGEYLIRKGDEEIANGTQITKRRYEHGETFYENRR